MHPSSIDGVMARADAAVTIPELRKCLIDVLLIAAQLNAELNDLRTRKPAIVGAIASFQKSHKDRTIRR